LLDNANRDALKLLRRIRAAKVWVTVRRCANYATFSARCRASEVENVEGK